MKIEEFSTNIEKDFDSFMESESSSIMIVTGPTGSGKTRGVLNYIIKKTKKPSVFLLPRKTNISIPVWAKHVVVRSLSQFVNNTVMTQQFHPLDVLVVDEFHVENTEWKVLLRALGKNMIPWKKLVFISATFSDYHYDLIAEQFGVDRMKDFRSVYVERLGGRIFKTDIQYISEVVWNTCSSKCSSKEKKENIENTENNHKWVFSSVHYVIPDMMHHILHYLLKMYGEKKGRRPTRVLVFLPTPETCEIVADLMRMEESIEKKPSAYKYVTVHGQKSREEIDRVINAVYKTESGFSRTESGFPRTESGFPRTESGFPRTESDFTKTEVILATNILETSITLAGLDLVIDFGICYAPDAMGNIVQRYCTQSEMIQRSGRTGRLCDGTVYRVMPLDFFEWLVYAIPHKTEWGHFLLQCALQDQIPVLQSIFTNIDSSSMDEREIVNELQKLESYHLLNVTHNHQYTVSYSKEKVQQLIKSNFQIRSFPLILHLWDKSNASNISDVSIFMMTLLTALLDTIYRFGMYRLFYIPRIESYSYRYLLRCWNDYLQSIQDAVYKHHRTQKREEEDQLLWRMVEMVLTVIKCPSYSNELQINGRIWNQFLLRWKTLLGPDFFNRLSSSSYTTMKKGDFLLFIQNFISKNQGILPVERWNIFKKNERLCTFIQMIKDRQQVLSTSIKDSKKTKCILFQGEWIMVLPEYKEEMRRLFWYLPSSSATPTDFLPDWSNYYYTNESLSLRPHISLHEELVLSCPRVFKTHYQNLTTHVQKKCKIRETIRNERSTWKTVMNDVMDEINNDVAYRFGMYKYFECKDRYYLTLSSSYFKR
jgi:Cdc6-like AAA superfamily ATPase